MSFRYIFFKIREHAEGIVFTDNTNTLRGAFCLIMKYSFVLVSTDCSQCNYWDVRNRIIKS